MRHSASLALFGLVWLSSCAHLGGQGKEPAADGKNGADYLFQQACFNGRSVTGARGSVFMKVNAPDASGQFPGDVLAKSPDELRLEVQNPLGGSEAVVKVLGQSYEVELPDQKKTLEKGQGSWGGIPLRWATDLFLGRIPCPQTSEIASIRLIEPEKLEVLTHKTLAGDAERFVYTFQKEKSEPWPSALAWERRGPFAIQVDFTFWEPEARTGSPLKWQARSSRGEVKVRWRDRRVTTQ